MITARVHCASKIERGEGADRQAQIRFQPDYQDGRNAEWAAASPMLSLTMTLNGTAADLFEQDKRYELRFVEQPD